MSGEQKILLIVGGGIAAYKTPELVRALRAKGAQVRCLLTAAAEQFVSALSLAGVSGDRVYENLFDLNDEAEMGHIRLSRDADLVLVAPATADLLAKMAHGTANDLASAALLATDKPVIVAPAMNVRMWEHAATQRNVQTLLNDGIRLIGPVEGDMACGEFGFGRMSEPLDIVRSIAARLSAASGTPQDLRGTKTLVTAGPTREPIDPVRYIANHSSGKQGFAIATALAARGAEVVLVSGPTALPDPHGVKTVRVETAREMLAACQKIGMVDVAVMCAAVADWRPIEASDCKLKKAAGRRTHIELTENPDILATLAADKTARPRLLIGFAAETDHIVHYGRDKLTRKKCDWILANNVRPESGIMGGDENEIVLITREHTENWARMTKEKLAQKLATAIADTLAENRAAERGAA